MANVTKTYYKEKITLTYLLTSIFSLVVFDISLDFMEGLPFEDILIDVILEGTLLVLVLFTANYIWKKFTFEKSKILTVEKNLEYTQKMADLWEKKSKQFVKEFQGHISQQFESWRLSKSEKEIAILILQGKSSKDMASLRFTSERTIRNQCRSIYEKSKLPGKNEFSAFFMKELIGDWGE